MMVESTEPEKDGRSIEEREQTIALQRMLALGTEIEQRKFRDAEDVFVELDKRIAEDEATPDDTVAWETIKAESLARWLR